MGEFSKRYYAIKNDREFRYLFKKGECCPSYGFVCYFRQTNRRRDRCGIVTGKKIGGAVTRNRARRVIREAFRIFDCELCAETDKRFDFIFVAREGTAELKSTKVLGTMRAKLKPMLLGKKPSSPGGVKKPDKKTGPESAVRRPAGDDDQ
jgi:ribonuclease P protein component